MLLLGKGSLSTGWEEGDRDCCLKWGDSAFSLTFSLSPFRVLLDHMETQACLVLLVPK